MIVDEHLRNPKTLLLLDAVGAAVTALATYFLLASEVLDTGLPVGLLYTLAMMATLFLCFDLVALSRCSDHTIPLRIIACLNLAYCICVVGALYVFAESVTQLGLAYFCVEVAILVPLSILEWTVACRSQ